MPYTDNEGTEVAGGKHVVPDGVAVEELDGGKKKLSEECPEQLKELLERCDLVQVYDDMVAAIVEEGKTRSVFGNWKDAEFESVLDEYRDLYADKGVKVAFCKRSSGSSLKARRWIEFIDVERVPDYIPQYDISNNSGQVIRTVYSRLEFPNGVAVEEFKQWGGRKKLKEKVPVYVVKMLTGKDLMTEYYALVDACVEQGVGRKFKGWNLKKLKLIIDEHRPKFEAKGVALFVSHKEEYVHHGNSGHTEFFRWIEFVDREIQPNYYPQRDATTKDEKCVIS